MLERHYYAAALVVFMAAPAAAQPDYERFIPVEIGNEWQFGVFDASGTSLGTTYQFVVVGDTVLDGGVYFVYTRTDHHNGVASQVATCAARVLAGENPYGEQTVTADIVPLYGNSYWNCQFRDCFPAPIVPLRIFESGGTIVVGGSPYAVEATIRSATGASGPGGYMQEWYSHNALDIGPYSCTYHENSQLTWSTALSYARIGGSVYGTPISAEVAPTPSRLELEVFPNPFTSELRASIRGARSSLTVELFDSLGRLVVETVVGAPGESGALIRIPILTRLPAGVYLLRVRDEDSNETTVSVITL